MKHILIATIQSSLLISGQQVKKYKSNTTLLSTYIRSWIQRRVTS